MKKALVVANLAGFAFFLTNDFEILKSNGYEIVFMADGTKTDWTETRKKLETLNISFVNVIINSKKPFCKDNYKAYKFIKKFINNERFDLIHCHTPISGMLVRLASKKARKKGAKVIYTTHGLSYHSDSSFKTKFIYSRFESFLSKYSDAIITINHEDYCEVKKMKCKNVFLLPGVGLKCDKFFNLSVDIDNYKKSLDIPLDHFLIVSVGEISTRKNHIAIIKGIELLEEKSKITYVVCGGGIDNSYKQSIIDYAKKVNVNLRMVGFRKDAAKIMYCSDIGAIPSIREGLGMSGLESLALGKPIIGSNVQGIKDYLIDGVTGYSFKPFDYNKIAECIQKFIYMSKEEYVIMSKNCIELSKKFDIDNSRRVLTSIYKDLFVIDGGDS